MADELLTRTVELASGPLGVLQPAESAELPDDGAVEWAPIAPYWSVLWRSGVALAEALAGRDLRGLKVVELGCGLGLASLAAARAGATVLASDGDPEAIALLERNAARNGLRLETAVVEWGDPETLVDRGPFDLVLAADVLYERGALGPLLALLPRLAPEALIADPGRPLTADFLERSADGWQRSSETYGVVHVHRLSRAGSPRGCSRQGP